MSLFIGILMGFYLSAYAWPILLVIITDDQGYSKILAHGNPVLQSPNLDRLLHQNLRLSDCHVAPIYTPPVASCSLGWMQSLMERTMSVAVVIISFLH